MMMQILDKGFVELIDHMGNDDTVVSAARVSYLGQNKGAERDKLLIEYLIKNGHTSPFEQVEFQFRVKCPLFIARQWHRHRTWSYNEVSRRYTSEEIDFYIPDSLNNQSSENKQMVAGQLDEKLSSIFTAAIENQCRVSMTLYETMLNAGVAREQARMILPQNMYTSFYAKTDLHNLFHFIEIRNHPHAQMEMRAYAQGLEDLIKPLVPVCYAAWKEHNERRLAE